MNYIFHEFPPTLNIPNFLWVVYFFFIKIELLHSQFRAEHTLLCFPNLSTLHKRSPTLPILYHLTPYSFFISVPASLPWCCSLPFPPPPPVIFMMIKRRRDLSPETKKRLCFYQQTRSYILMWPHHTWGQGRKADCSVKDPGVWKEG